MFEVIRYILGSGSLEFCHLAYVSSVTAFRITRRIVTTFKLTVFCLVYQVLSVLIFM